MNDSMTNKSFISDSSPPTGVTMSLIQSFFEVSSYFQRLIYSILIANIDISVNFY